MKRFSFTLWPDTVTISQQDSVVSNFTNKESIRHLLVFITYWHSVCFVKNCFESTTGSTVGSAWWHQTQGMRVANLGSNLLDVHTGCPQTRPSYCLAYTPITIHCLKLLTFLPQRFHGVYLHICVDICQERHTIWFDQVVAMFVFVMLHGMLGRIQLCGLFFTFC